VADVVAELLVARQADGSSPGTWTTSSRASSASPGFECPISNVRGRHRPVFRDLGLSARSVNTYRTAISNLFSSQGCDSTRQGSTISEVQPWKELIKPVPILSPAEMRRLPVRRHTRLTLSHHWRFAGLRQSRLSGCGRGTSAQSPSGFRRRQPSGQEQQSGPSSPPSRSGWMYTERVTVRSCGGRMSRTSWWTISGRRDWSATQRPATLLRKLPLGAVEDAARVAHKLGNSRAMVHATIVKL
jgi:hypothetical protein